MKLLKENIGKRCSLDVGLGSVFLTAKSIVVYMKLKSIFTAKEIVNKITRQGLPGSPVVKTLPSNQGP